MDASIAVDQDTIVICANVGPKRSPITNTFVPHLSSLALLPACRFEAGVQAQVHKTGSQYQVSA